MNTADFVRIHAHHDRRVLTQHDRRNQDAIDQLIRSGSAHIAESNRGVCQPASTFDPVPSAADPSR